MQKGLAFGLVFLITGPFPFDPGGKRACLQPFCQFFDTLTWRDHLLCALSAFINPRLGLFGQHVGFHIDKAFLIGAIDLCQFRNRGASDKIRQWNQPVFGPQLYCIEGAEQSIFFWKADANLNFFIAAIDAHFIQ